MLDTIIWKGDRVLMLDQRKLPWVETYYVCRTWRDVAEGIRKMVIRGAPAIGIAAAMGVALGASTIKAKRMSVYLKRLDVICDGLKKSRPTAVNLAWAVERMRTLARSLNDQPLERISFLLDEEALEILREDVEINKMIGRAGESVVPAGGTVLTHCNAGALATGGYGTALGVVRAAVEAGKKIAVLADETRPFLQGARLTVWELMKDDIPATLITDNAAGSLMRKGEVQMVIVGADRIAANGDVANKIGTYSVAVLARENKIPFYVAAPLSTIDMSLPSGDDIPIEERSSEEVTGVFGHRIAPEGAAARNPAFDVTPGDTYVTGIITEKGIARAPYVKSLKELFAAE